MQEKRRVGLLLLFLGLSGYVAALVTVGVHEIVGHGVVALALGGEFRDVYFNPIHGLANTETETGADPWVSAGGTVFAGLIGLLAWRWFHVRKRRERVAGATTVFVWLVANEAVLDSIGYTTVQPALGAWTGVDFGDWLVLSRRFGISPWLFLIPGLVLSVVLAERFVSEAHEIVTTHLSPRKTIHPLLAYWLLLAPGVVLLLGYWIVTSRWSDGSTIMALGSVLGVPAVGVLGVVRRRKAPRPSAHDGAAPISVRSIAAWCVGLTAIAVATGYTFGPATELRRGLLLSTPRSDQYADIAQVISVRVDLTTRPRPTASFTSTPRRFSGSPFRRELTDALASQGPSGKAALELANFVASWNLGGASAENVRDLERRDAGWRWTVDLGPYDESVEVKLWPLTRVPESYIAELRLDGESLRVVPPVPATVETSDDGRWIHWKRPEGMSTIDSFVVELR